jgi:hypothetical protein
VVTTRDARASSLSHSLRSVTGSAQCRAARRLLLPALQAILVVATITPLLLAAQLPSGTPPPASGRRRRFRR